MKEKKSSSRDSSIGIIDRNLRIVLADDHVMFLDACTKMLEPHFEITATFTNGRTLLESAPALEPDVLILDIGMPLLNGLDAGRQLKKLLPKAKLIFLTMHEDPDLAREAMRAGASGYVLKTSAASELFKAIHEAFKGRRYLTPAIARAMEDAFILEPETGNLPKELTPRQREVLQLLAEGHPMKEAAYILTVTPRTIAFHKYRMMQQLGLKNSAELIHFAASSHIVFPTAWVKSEGTISSVADTLQAPQGPAYPS